MAAETDIDTRTKTKNGSIRVKTWVNPKTGKVVGYSMAYINHSLMSWDNGRVVGFDDKDWYAGFASKHHYHWFGRVFENLDYTSFEKAQERFQRFLKRLKQHYGKNY